MAEMKKGGLFDCAGSESDVDWITVDNGQHVPIKDKQTKQAAINNHFKKVHSITETANSEGNDKQQESKKFGVSNSNEFAVALTAAKTTIRPNAAWRVTAHTQEELDKEYPCAKLHVTKGGSTVAVTKDGDIVSVCKSDGDRETRGRDLLALAVKNGGNKMDSYAGNHGFYLKCGFEPVSWCEWNDDYAPDDWSEQRDEREPIIFYRYTGKTSTESVEEFCVRVKVSVDYDAAKENRDKSK